MSEHLTSEELAELLAGWLGRREARSIVAHLVQSCEVCIEALQPRPVEEDAYEEAISAAFEKVRARERERAAAVDWLGEYLGAGRRSSYFKLPLSRRRQLATWGFCDVLLRASYALRRDFPSEMVHLAEIAVAASRLVPFPAVVPERSRRHLVLARFKDLEARASAELANAYRVADDLPRSEQAIHRAFECFHRGTGDPLLLARLNDVAASLFASQRRFAEAFACLAEAYSLFRVARDRHSAGRILISVGLFSGYAGDLEVAVERLYQGLCEIDRNRDPDLVFRALHNLVLFTVDLGDLREARQLLLLMQPIYAVRGKLLDRARLKWTEGRIAVELEILDEAEAALLEAKEFFVVAGLPYKAALTGLELAAVWFRQGKTAKVRGIVGELVGAFGRVGVQREALAAVLVLHNALLRERASLELIERTATALLRLSGERPGHRV